MEPTLNDRIAALRKEGKSQQAIADALGISQAQVSFTLKGLGLPGRIGLKRQSAIPPETIAALRAEKEAGWGYKALAKKYGLSVGTIWKWVNMPAETPATN